MTNTLITWIGIALCLSQSGIFSGLNLALFGVSRLKLEIEADLGNKAAMEVLKLREKSNFTLATILWGNVGVNTLLAILSNSLLAGVFAFIFSTVVITFLGEIIPQAYFSRHALRMSSALSPLLKFYQFLLYPIAKPSSKILDWWLGPEGIQFFQESALREVIKKHIESSETDIDMIEGIGALNFLVFDDLPVGDEGEPIDPESVIYLPKKGDLPECPEFKPSPSDPFLRKINISDKKWVVIVDVDDNPYMVLDSDGFLRNVLFYPETTDPYKFCHRPVIVEDINTLLGSVIMQMQVEPAHITDDVIDKDIILLWGKEKRIITGADILGRLLRGIATSAPGMGG